MSNITKLAINPQYISFQDFADRFCEEYVEALLPIPQGGEAKWVDWASAVAGNETFSPYNIPQPSQVTFEGKIISGFKTWQEWANAVYICLTNNMNTN